MGAFLLASLTLRPVRALRRGAESISRTGQSARLPEPRTHDEIGALARTLNAMLALIQSELEVTLRGVEERRELRVAHSDAGPIQAHRLRLDQAIANLVENAFRYGKGPIGLVVRRPPGSVELAVVDAGQGLPEAFVGRAFERFTRADPSRHGHGTGLGLAIVDLIARAHGGEAYIIQGAGSCEVGVRLPLSG